MRERTNGLFTSMKTITNFSNDKCYFHSYMHPSIPAGSARQDESLSLKTTFGNAAALPLADLPGVVQADQSKTATASLKLRRGQMGIELFVSPHTTAYLRVKSLKLDEIECASLRGHLTEAEVELDTVREKGEGHIEVKNPRFSGVQGSDMMLMHGCEHMWLNTDRYTHTYISINLSFHSSFIYLIVKVRVSRVRSSGWMERLFSSPRS